MPTASQPYQHTYRQASNMLPTSASNFPGPIGPGLGAPSWKLVATWKLEALISRQWPTSRQAWHPRTRVRLRIRLPDRKLTADIAAKSLREAQAAIREAGADAIALVLQGCLVEGDVIAEAGLSAQSKAAK